MGLSGLASSHRMVRAMATDGYVQDLSSRDFFKDGMQGLPGITNTLQDRMGTPEPINVFKHSRI